MEEKKKKHWTIGDFNLLKFYNFVAWAIAIAVGLALLAILIFSFVVVIRL